jgi:hypothetical protein
MGSIQENTRGKKSRATLSLKTTSELYYVNNKLAKPAEWKILVRTTTD